MKSVFVELGQCGCKSTMGRAVMKSVFVELGQCGCKSTMGRAVTKSVFVDHVTAVRVLTGPVWVQKHHG